MDENSLRARKGQKILSVVLIFSFCVFPPKAGPLFFAAENFKFFCYAMDSKETSVYREVESEEQPDAFVWDFGMVKEGSVVKHDFIFKNSTKNVLNINDLSSSCGCTVSEVKKKTLMPDEETTIEVQLKTKGYSGDIKQFVYINTDNMEQPVSRLTVKANVIK